MNKVYRSSKKMAKPVKSFKSWSPFRPIKDEVAEEFSLSQQLGEMLEAKFDTRWDQADGTGLAGATVKRLADGKGRRAQGLTLEMAARALGYRIGLVREAKAKKD